MQVNVNSYEYAATSVKLSYQATVVTGQKKEDASSGQTSVNDFLPK